MGNHSTNAANRAATVARRATGAVLALLATLACVPAALGDGGGGSHLWRGLPTDSGWGLAYGWPGPPPPITPALAQQFALLLGSYLALDVDKSISFSQWIAMNGVVDVRTHWTLMWMYWSYLNRTSVA